MEKIRIITDSASDIPNNDSIPANLSIMPLTIFFGEEEYLDGKTITNAGKAAPEKCPVCGHEQGYFIRVSMSPYEYQS